MSAVGQVCAAVVEAIERAGCAAVAAYDEERMKRYPDAVCAVGVRTAGIAEAGCAAYLGQRVDEATQSTREVYGRRMTLVLSLDIYAPREKKAAGCETAAEAVTQALMTELPAGLRVKELHWDETAWDKVSGRFHRSGRAEYAAYFTAEKAEDGTVFTDFILKGTVRKDEQYDP